MIKQIKITSVCNKVLDKYEIETRDWGLVIQTNSIEDACQVAYLYRNAKHGVKIEHWVAVDKFAVNVWNDRAKEIGVATV